MTKAGTILDNSPQTYYASVKNIFIEYDLS